MLDEVWLQKRNEKIFFIILIILLVILTALNWIIGLLMVIVVCAAILGMKKSDYQQEKILMKYLDNLSTGVSTSAAYSIANLPIGIALIDEKSLLVWGNSVFRDWLGAGIEEEGRLQQLLPNTRLSKLWGKSGWFDCHIEDSWFHVFYKYIEADSEGGTGFMAMYMMDRTDAEESRIASEDAMPVFCRISMDNIQEVAGTLTDVQQSTLISNVNECILAEFSGLDGFIKQYSPSAYIACISRAALRTLMERKFDILDKVRNIHTVNRVPVTLSIGAVQADTSFADQMSEAETALDLALGRGGDQAVIRIGNDVRIFGGKSQAVGSHTRVRVRVVAQAVRELVSESDLVLIMGHDYEDYDSLGAAVGVAHMARASGIPAYVVVSRFSDTSEKMRECIDKSDTLGNILINPDRAEELITEKTLLFVVDTHRTDMVPAPELLSKIQRKVIIDHHRRSDKMIPRALLVYMEPSSSSASELITELIQYYPDEEDLSAIEATCLYAGIVVDTKNFSVQTGVRTFDAASYLRRSGADVSLVRELFNIDIDTVRIQSEILSHMETRDGCIVFAECPEGTDQVQTLAGRIADFLVCVEGIRCSFLFYHVQKYLRISARSNGSVNVQTIMEKLGGGGHMTVSGAQVKEGNIEEIKEFITEQVHAQLKEEK